MGRLRGKVPSLAALAAFEAAARLGGFTKAASELGVTQAAISRQIRALEDDFGTPLFVRGRTVRLTAAGQVLADAVSEAFDRMAVAIDKLHEGRDPALLTVSTHLSFSHFWLLPRLPAFRHANPEVKLRVLSQDAPIDLRQGEVDVVIRYGRPPFADGATMASLAEQTFPVCSPQFAAQASCESVGAERLRELPLIEAHNPETDWLTWPEWFAMAGLPRPSRPQMLVFRHYSDAVYAAMAGEGVVLGWQKLLERPLGDGRLTRIGDVAVRPAEAHHMVVAQGEAERDAVAAFSAWLAAEFDRLA